MSLEQSTQQRLDQAIEGRDHYRPNQAIQRELGNRMLGMITGPAAIGKTHIMRAITELDPRFALSSTLSTRSPQLRDEPGMFRLLDHTDENISKLLNKIDAHELVQYDIHPTEYTFYGSELEDHPGTHNLLATLSGSIDQLSSVGFGRTALIALTSPPADWLHRFNERYMTTDQHRLKRLFEAAKSYDDLLRREDVIWVINRDGLVKETAIEVIDAIDGKPPEASEALAYTHRIRQLIDNATQRAYTSSHE